MSGELEVPMSDVKEGQGLYNEVQCIMDNGHMRSSLVNRQTSENIDCLPATSLAGGNEAIKDF